jgi:FemAB-related protein (PEP-CTERM system-associated)
MPATIECGVAVRRAAPETDAADWRRTADALPATHLAHAPQWAGIIRRAYGHAPLYLAAHDGGGGMGLLPAVIVKRPVFGTVVASMPFLDGGGPCGSSPHVLNALAGALVDEARRIGARGVELRCSQRLDVPAAPTEHKVNLVMTLPADPGELWKRLDRSVRNQIRKAEKSGLTAETGGAEKLDDFYAIHAERMRDLGSPAHHRTFFRSLLDGFDGGARITLVRKGDIAVGGLIALAYRDSVVVPWASCRKDYFALCPNMLLYWETIRAACRDGFRHFDFGRSTRGSGTYRFKCQWGAAETPLYWYRIPVGHQKQSADNGSSGGRVNRYVVSLWQRLPLAVAQSIGPRVRKYLIQ